LRRPPVGEPGRQQRLVVCSEAAEVARRPPPHR
jgi:hypothetical protein